MRSAIEWVRTQNRIPEITARTVEGSQNLAELARQRIAESARERAPVGDAATDSTSGELRDSIVVDGDEVIVDSDHGLFVEFGTVFMGAEPFFLPAIRDGQEVLRAGFARGLME